LTKKGKKEWEARATVGTDVAGKCFQGQERGYGHVAANKKSQLTASRVHRGNGHNMPRGTGLQGMEYKTSAGKKKRGLCPHMDQEKERGRQGSNGRAC